MNFQMKNMYSKISFTLLAFVMGLTVMAQTQIPAIVSTSANWTAAGSPYIMSGNVLIEASAKIIIEPGAVVQSPGTNLRIIVDGELQAIGTNDSVIMFDKVTFDFSDKSADYDPITGRGSQFQYCLFNATGAGGGVRTLYLRETSMLVSNCKFLDGYYNIYPYSTKDTLDIIVEKSIFIGISTYYGYPLYSGSSNARIRITDCYAENMNAIYLSKDAEVRNCTFVNFTGSQGIRKPTFYNKLVLECNLFHNFKYTVLDLSYPAVGAVIDVTYNTFDSSKNHIEMSGSYISNPSRFTVENNNFLTYSQYSIYNRSGSNPGVADTVNYRSNWWGTTNITDIAEGIFDFNDDITTPAFVDFSGQLTKAVTTCKNGDPIGQADTSRSTGSTSVSVISNFASNVYPNPATNQLNINLLGNPGKIARILDFSGKLNLETKLTSDESIIDISLLPNGLYLFEIEGEGISSKHKLIISK